MRDVAARAGVSFKTVSRVLNGEAGVHEDTARKVARAVDELGFRRNESAAMLRRSGQSSRTIGLVIDDLANPFYATLMKAVEDVTRARGHLLVAGSSDQDPVLERSLLLELCARRVDALLVVASGSDLDYLAGEIAHGTQVVAVDRPAGGLDVDTVVSANADGARAAVEHLLALGHRRIGFVGDTAPYTSAERYAGYEQALQAAGLPADGTLARSAHDVSAAALATTDLLAQGATALFAGNTVLTRGAVEALAGARHRPALVGFDDFAFADLLTPSVSVVAQDAAAVGRRAAELAFERIAGRVGPARRVVLPTRLVVRGSSAAAGPRVRSRPGQT